MSLDVLAVGAHPDDVEVGIGALIRKLVVQGRRVGILDLTRGELGTRGSVEERGAEAADAARILGVVQRENAGLPDGRLADTEEHWRAVIPFLRRSRPAILLAPMRDDRHPDHEAAHFLMRKANHLAGLKKLQTEEGLEPWRARRIFYYSVYLDTALPDLVVDVTDQFDTKIEALSAFKSQFHNPGYAGDKTFISSQRFWDGIRSRAAYWGTRLATAYPRDGGPVYGEVLFSDGPLAMESLPGLDAPL